ncbi:hypothetical protein D3C80_1252910 [compost metagenome]
MEHPRVFITSTDQLFLRLPFQQLYLLLPITQSVMGLIWFSPPMWIIATAAVLPALLLSVSQVREDFPKQSTEAQRALLRLHLRESISLPDTLRILPHNASTVEERFALLLPKRTLKAV